MSKSPNVLELWYLIDVYVSSYLTLDPRICKYSGTLVLWSPTGLSQSERNREVTLIVNMGTEA